MTNKAIVLSVFAALFMLTGCPDKKVNVGSDGDSSQSQPSKPVDSDNTSSSGNGGTIEVDSVNSVYFDFDKYNIRQDMQSVVDAAASNISSRANYQVVIEGNTDEFGTDEYNYALGTKRAIAVREALVVKGINKDGIRVVSFGESKPVCTDKTKECYQKNRRSDIRLAE